MGQNVKSASSTSAGARKSHACRACRARARRRRAAAGVGAVTATPGTGTAESGTGGVLTPCSRRELAVPEGRRLVERGLRIAASDDRRFDGVLQALVQALEAGHAAHIER